MESYTTQLSRKAEYMEVEVDEIIAFMDSYNFDNMSDDDQRDVEDQYSVMSIYLDILRKRIDKELDQTEETYYERY